ncbi:hypothetical protein B0J11DRAFT_578596 [Dendryphion nanum]|uniref:F-box domain-containing protein n=1 Tax=Dendryphion nanum TaxID=256645 RepID=A0A9P9E002_9PLEO|nr:hypothetical protein B0J11DRAFT_578596 [Dendryphion nanum]
MEPPQAETQPSLLTIPRELREDIISHLVLPEHVFTSTSSPNAQSLHQTSETPDTYIDTRIYIPVRFPSNVLSVCRQLRLETIHYVCRLANAPALSSIANETPVEETQSNILAARTNQSDEDVAERHRDNGSVRITMEIKRPIRSRNMGYYTPVRDTISPRFVALEFIFRHLKRIKFVVWGGMAWWEGPPKNRGELPRERNKSTRISRDQTDGATSTHEAEQFLAPAPESNATLDPLSVSMNALLNYMPGVEEVEIDIIIHAREYLNWNLPENRQQGILGWFDAPLFTSTNKKFGKVDRRLMICMTQECAITFHRKLEERKPRKDAVGTTVVRVSTGATEMTEDWENLPEDPVFDQIYDRIE